MMDKAWFHYLNLSPDLNESNHAYTAGKSCATAIQDVQKVFRQFREIAKKDSHHRYVTIACPEDIKSAFESVDANIMAHILDLMYDQEEDPDSAVNSQRVMRVMKVFTKAHFVFSKFHEPTATILLSISPSVVLA